MSDQLQRYVEVWRATAADTVELLRELDPSDWAKPTDLPGWNVRYIAAHLAHIESDLAGNPQLHVDVPPAPHIKGLMGQYTETGPLARDHLTTDEIIDEFESSVAKRYDALQGMFPLDPKAPGDGFAGLIGWSWETFLSNRAVDLWMHQQDVRRATGHAGGFDTQAAAHTADVFAGTLPYVVAKRVGAPAGTTVVLEVTGPNARVVAATVGADRRGVPLLEASEDPTVRIRLDFESWIVLAGGRRTPEQVDVAIAGDDDLAGRILSNLAVTP